MENLLAFKPESDQLQIIKPSPGLTLAYSAACNCVLAKWEGFVTKKMLIGGANHALKLLTKTQCPNLLVDHRSIHGTWPDITDWQQNIWLPNAVRAGLKKYAHVACSGSYSVMTAEHLFSRINGMVELMIFSELDDATLWLRSGLEDPALNN
ncbi:MAG TPA: hypothetical protein VK927_09415 [Adhaeribacter sp.]|nr:hypothetical protein [Adhaeribacter sp.]